MNITRNNKFIALKDFELEIARCDFCAIDQEMTGIDDPDVPLVFGASPEEIYRVKRLAVERYIAFQFGVSLFTKTENNAYEVRHYNFFLLNDNGDIRLSMSAIDFLATHRMNFQQWLTTGMNYCTAEEEMSCIQKDSIDFDENESTILQQVLSMVEDWLETPSDAGITIKKNCSSHCAKSIARYVLEKSDFPISIQYSGKSWLGETITFQVKRFDEEQWNTEQKRRHLLLQRKHSDLLGFRLFWKALVNAKKPIIGHNFMSDIMFMMHMHETSLPTDYNAYKKQVQECFPTVYDTKTMATLITGESAFRATHLGGLYEECKRRFGITRLNFNDYFVLPAGFYDYDESCLNHQSKAHEAAYDAFMTGIAYFIMHKLYYPDTDTLYRNKISSFGSVYYMCVDDDDTLVNASTFIVKVTNPCYGDQLEALFFQMDADPEKEQRKDSKAIVPNCRLSGIDKDQHGKFTSFCATFTTPETKETIAEKFTKLRQRDVSELNIDVGLIDSVSFSNP